VRVAAIIVAGGSGERFGDARGKQLAKLAGRPVLAWSAEAFAAASGVGLVVLVAPPARAAEYREVVESATGQVVVLAPSGETRQDSVRAGLSAVPSEFEAVIVHDGARPLVTAALVSACVARLAAEPGVDGAVVGQPCVDTVKTVDPDGLITGTPDRSALWTVQTPQVFRTEALRAAHERAAREGYFATDDAALVEYIGGRVAIVEGPRSNIKVTLPDDLVLAEALLRGRGGSR